MVLKNKVGRRICRMDIVNIWIIKNYQELSLLTLQKR
jgi:hypothetical protein